ncbi:SGT1-domain-containing protein [Hygrophoropsis aurantiaca]|uniref:SGT1-domain-containing protein n=1 Tax=Hygrophoropsis aurantiaca TaxID=72124 RepID=A0ACB8AP98_9AGAM|nr:SGT1-domain-containing protein [Hygrophoropsis aurantiaca]
MDIFNRPPAISEDMLQYSLYPSTNLADKASVTTLATCLQSYVEALLPDFLWHRDPFQLKVVSDPDNKNSWMLEGRMRVGDCVDDEWCVVWLLRDISAKWDLAISVFDSDGEFLLIEAAEALPSWVKPTNSENRVWIYSSHLQLIPLEHISAPSRIRRRRRLPASKDSDDEGDIGDDADEYLAPDDALALIRDRDVDTLAPRSVEDIVWQRISGYPASARNHVHTTKAYIPNDIAKALSINPSLVQKPVETFYTRDAIQLRAAHRMTRFPPQPSTLRTIRMTRTSYAQLVGQKFYPPKIFGRWTEQEGTDQWRWRDIGMKLACGFEMLYQESKSRSDITDVDAINASADARKEALRRNPDYITYIKNLISAGYFKGEVEGSQLWGELESKAANAFVEVRREEQVLSFPWPRLRLTSVIHSDASRPSFSMLVNSAVSKAPDTLQAATQETDDSDDWMTVDAQNFDEMLERTMRPTGAHSASQAMDVDDAGQSDDAEERFAKLQASKLQDLAKKVEQFVEGEGDIEGARFADEELSDDEEFSDEKFSDSDDEDVNDEPEINDAERKAMMDKLVPALKSSEYGQMPASFHSNSQRVAKTVVETEPIESPEIHQKSQSHTAESKPIREPILPRDKYDGVDSDDETDDEDAPDEDDESEEDRPQVVGDIEVDMEEEEEEFLEFSRQALGISDEQWKDIVQERKTRGAFVPTSVVAENQFSASSPSDSTAKPSQGKLRDPVAGSRPNTNPNLDSFEAVMQAMDAELSKTRKPTTKAKGPSHSQSSAADKGKGKASVEDDDSDDDADIEAKMEAELKAMFQSGEFGDEDDDVEEPMDYNLIKNFLESFKSQGGLSGPVGNLVGRLQPGWTLPRDES